MRRVAKLSAACLATAALALSATACGKTSSDDASSSSSGGAKGGIKIGLAYDVGGRGDRSFNDSAARGADKAEKQFGGSIKELTAKTSDTPADRVQRLTDLAQAGYSPIIAVGYTYAPAVQQVAKQFPKTSFGLIDSVVDGKNVNSITFTEEQGSYLAGVAAALKTKKDHVGFIGGVDSPLIKKFQAGYVQGVHDTNAKIKVDVQYLSHGTDTSGFSSPDKGQQAAQGMLDNGADVVYSAAGSSGTGAIEAVNGVKGAWAIGVDSDQYNIPGLAKYKSSILTSVVKNVDVGVFDFIQSVKNGKPLAGNNVYSLAKGGVSLATSGGYLKDIQPKLDAAKQKIVDGKIKVKTTP
ncbi:BMP family protein [Streptomyces griseofuscus]|uniref:BMP family ABC transporter substrate-binding protein n=1 Tax=Streptomyces griseofuscus TaxID=146922 RepID=A0A7H1PZB3_9ACTN|nr:MULTISPECIES: BMP family ABC transporter substrate-binding protein [Streptomyces]MYQ93194.1 BMP family ABC transporter substrate-binding protein [Streptomyces sp. SID4946]QNT93393.1 BMP family ABC transporter substrate-binding protein [Streptomyces griseofuscus]RRQ77688.1 BMP family ABC transporter substrate-binding protein [Streptomyces griseofuscus]SCF80023.1 basic membrane protein A [Streptomyces sp. DconLS]SCF89503.1 basic membrane protein A [Streptomyces sp. LamerLS-31b]